jgi:GDP-4-dehydro-6-deoxy-D-mannose reductase
VRALITGASGFAGGWLGRTCAAAGDEVVMLTRAVADLRDPAAVAAAVRAATPNVVYHLAALSSVGRSWDEPAATLEANVGGAINLLEAVRAQAPDARVVWVSSCEVYGSPTALPTAENAPAAPASPYAVSKLAGEQLARVYAQAHGLRVVVARPYSHSGPGQRPIFLLSNLARQAAEGRRAGIARLRVVTGNPDTRRDFCDVRDVVRAYRELAALEPADGVYNVCSGVSVSTAEQVAALAELIAPITVEHVVDPARVRASEVMELRGDHARLTAATGWEPEIPFRRMMADTVQWWAAELANGT